MYKHEIGDDDPRALPTPAPVRGPIGPRILPHLYVMSVTDGVPEWMEVAGSDPLDPHVRECVLSGRFVCADDPGEAATWMKKIVYPYAYVVVTPTGQHNEYLCETLSFMMRPVRTFLRMHSVPDQFTLQHASLYSDACILSNPLRISEWKHRTQPTDRLAIHAVGIPDYKILDLDQGVPTVMEFLETPRWKMRLYWVNLTQGISTCVGMTHVFWNLASETATVVVSHGWRGAGSDVFVARSKLNASGKTVYTYPASIMGEHADQLEFVLPASFNRSDVGSGRTFHMGQFVMHSDWLYRDGIHTYMQLAPMPMPMEPEALVAQTPPKMTDILRALFGDQVWVSSVGDFYVARFANANFCTAEDRLQPVEQLTRAFHAFGGMGGCMVERPPTWDVDIFRRPDLYQRTQTEWADHAVEPTVYEVLCTGLVIVSLVASRYVMLRLQWSDDGVTFYDLPPPFEGYLSEFRIYVKGGLRITYVRHPSFHTTEMFDRSLMPHTYMGIEATYEHAFRVNVFALTDVASPHLLFSARLNRDDQLVSGPSMRPMVTNLPFTFGLDGSDKEHMCPLWTQLLLPLQFRNYTQRGAGAGAGWRELGFDVDPTTHVPLCIQKDDNVQVLTKHEEVQMAWRLHCVGTRSILFVKVRA